MLGNGEFLEQEAEYQAIAARVTAEIQAMTPEEISAKEALQTTIKIMDVQALKMNSSAPNAPLPLNSYQQQMRRAILAGDFEAFNKLMVISKFRFAPNTPLGMYRFRILNGKKVYVPFSDIELANLFVYMSQAINRYGYNRFAEPGATCDWNHLLDLYVNRQEVAKKQYPNTDWRHVVEIYPGRYICQVYRPSTWVKIRKPVVAAVAIVAAIYLGPVIMSKIGGESAAAAAGGTGEAATAGIVGAGTKAGAVTAVTTKATTAVAITTKATGAVAAITGVAETGTLFTKVQSAVNLLNKGRAVDAIIKGELPPPPIGISGSNFTEWALDIAKIELINEAKEAAGGYLSEKAQEKILKENEARLRAEIIAMQAELAGLALGTDIEPSPFLDPDVRARIAAMQEIERKRDQQNAMLLAAGAGALLLMTG